MGTTSATPETMACFKAKASMRHLAQRRQQLSSLALAVSQLATAEKAGDCAVQGPPGKGAASAEGTSPRGEQLLVPARPRSRSVLLVMSSV